MMVKGWVRVLQKLWSKVGVSVRRDGGRRLG